MAHFPQRTANVTGTGAIGLGDGSDSVASTIAIQISGTFSATLTFQATVDGTNYVAILATDATAGSTATTATAPAIVRIDATGFKDVQVNCTAYTSGTAVLTWRPVVG